MQTALMDWLANTGSQVFTIAMWGFLLVNGAAIAAVFVTRDRGLVNRWTGHLLAANVVLVGAGLGVPLMTSMARLAISAVSPSVRITLPTAERELDELEALQPPDARRR